MFYYGDRRYMSPKQQFKKQIYLANGFAEWYERHLAERWILQIEWFSFNFFSVYFLVPHQMKIGKISSIVRTQFTYLNNVCYWSAMRQDISDPVLNKLYMRLPT